MTNKNELPEIEEDAHGEDSHTQFAKNVAEFKNDQKQNPTEA